MDASTAAEKLQNWIIPAGPIDGERTITTDDLRKINAYWRAANYLSVGQIYLYDNPLLREPLKLSHVKPLVVSHWAFILALTGVSVGNGELLDYDPRVAAPEQIVWRV